VEFIAQMHLAIVQKNGRRAQISSVAHKLLYEIHLRFDEENLTFSFHALKEPFKQCFPTFCTLSAGSGRYKNFSPTKNDVSAEGQY
jgi:hypothetical protein